MRYWVIGLGLVWGLLAGCSPRLAQQVSDRSDSTRTEVRTSTDRRDSSFFIREVTPVLLPGSTVDQVYTKEQLDSLINSLRSMPSVSRTIYATDPKMQTTLAIVLDSLGRINIRCTTAERTYYETSIRQGRILESAQQELVAKERVIRELEEKLMEYRKPLATRIFDNLKGLALFVLLIVVAAGVLIIKFKTKLNPFQ